MNLNETSTNNKDIFPLLFTQVSTYLDICERLCATKYLFMQGFFAFAY